MDERGWLFTSYTKYTNKDGTKKSCPSFISPQALHKNRVKNTLKHAKERAGLKGLPFNLTVEYLEKIFPRDGKCPALGTPLTWGIKSTDRNRNSPSLDRIVPELGYVEGNVMWVSLRANAIKTDASADEILSVGRFYKNMRM